MTTLPSDPVEAFALADERQGRELIEPGRDRAAAGVALGIEDLDPAHPRSRQRRAGARQGKTPGWKRSCSR